MARTSELSALWRADVGAGHDAALGRLLARYGEPHRQYHSVEHVFRVRRGVGDLLTRYPVPDPIAVRLAAWFHDVIYDVRRDDNELASAALAHHELTTFGAMPERIAAVHRLILSTAGHAPGATDEAVLIDADLAVLGADPAAYEAYRRGVRFEYRHVSDNDWRVGRAAVLRQLLDLPVIYTLTTADNARARANLTAERASLTGQ